MVEWDRMGPGERFAAEIEDGWGLSGVRLLSQRVSYPTRVVHRLASDQGDFVAKVYDRLESAEVVASLEVLLAVRDDGFRHAPAVRLTRAHQAVIATSIGPTVLMEHIPVDLSGSPDPGTWADIGAAIASLNDLSCRRTFSIPIGAALRDRLTRPPAGEYAVGIAPLVARLEHLASLPPEGVVHGEANPSNSARRDSGELALLDWDQAGMAPRALDYGYPLITCFISESLEVDDRSIQSFYGSYRAHGSRVDAGLAIDFALFHALRYMWFANTPQRWERIQFALRNESDLIDLLS